MRDGLKGIGIAVLAVLAGFGVGGFVPSRVDRIVDFVDRCGTSQGELIIKDNGGTMLLICQTEEVTNDGD